MSNSDIISALSLALTAIIFLLQTDDGLLKLKISGREKWIVIFILIFIILLTNHQIFERINLTFYFSFGNFYLLPTEWALIIFLFLLTIVLYRIFSPKIFNKNPEVIFELLKKYRAEKKYLKLQNLIQQTMRLKDFDEFYAEKLDDIIFNDHHLIEYFSSNCHELLIEFTKKYKSAAINQGEYFYNILNGLFAEKGNQIFSEIRLYQTEPAKSVFLSGWEFNASEFEYDVAKKYNTSQEIISWLVRLLRRFPFNLKEETAYFLKQFKEHSLLRNNEEIYSEDEICKVLSRDSLFNAIQLFRILLIELSFVDKKTAFHIDRPLLIFYSTWDFLESSTRLKQEDIQLDNDAYTISEYFLKYLFEAYCSLYILNKKVLEKRFHESKEDEKEDTSWIFHQLFRKLDSLIAKDIISEKSKVYFIERLIEFYFEFPDYIADNKIDACSNSFLYELRYSLDNSPWGNSELYKALFITACKKHEFYRKNNRDNIYRAKHFFEYLLPFSENLEDKICDI